MHAALRAVNLTGLDTFTAWRWLLPQANHTLASAAGAQRLGADLRLDTVLRFPNASGLHIPPLRLPLQTALEVFVPALTLGLRLDVAEAAVSALNLAEKTELGCLLRTVDACAVSDLSVGYDDVTLALSDDIDGAGG